MVRRDLHYKRIFPWVVFESVRNGFPIIAEFSKTEWPSA